MTFDPELAALMEPSAVEEARRRKARAQWAAEVVETSARTELQDAAEEVAGIAARHHGTYQRFALKLRNEQCPTCIHPMSVKARACEQRWHEDATHGVDAGPLCRWEPERAKWLAYEVVRRARMHSAGIENEEQLAVVPVAVTMPDAFPRVPEAFLEGPRQVAAAVQRFIFEGARCLTLCGPSGCLHADTPIYDPVDKTTMSVSRRWLLGSPFHVWALGPHGPVVAAAEPPQKFPPAQMMKVSLSNGETITVTPHHRFWTGTAWVTAADIYQSGRVPLASSSDTYLSTHAQDGSHWMGTIVGSLDDCHPECRSHDERPRPDQDSGQSSAPSQDGAPSCCLGPHSDDSECGCEHIPRGQRTDHPSMPGSDPSDGPSLELFLRPPGSQRRCGCRSTPSPSPRPEAIDQTHISPTPTDDAHRSIDSLHPLPSQPPAHHDRCVCKYTKGCATEQAVFVEGVTPMPMDHYYDFHVPVWLNYRACGVWNHNTWKSWGAAWVCASVDGSLWVDCTQIKQVNDAWELFGRKAESAPLVVLNDVGLEHDGNSFGRGEVSRLVNIRDDKALRTVITANIPMESADPSRPSLERMYGARLRDRLTRKSGIVCRVMGPSIRSQT